jgi:bifunctional non-homologous end joining protein LigD
MPAVVVSHPERVVFPDIGLTKGEVVDFYVRIADWIVPHLRGRPLTMQIFPKGVGEPGTYIKERRKHFPDWVPGVVVPTSAATSRKRGGEGIEMPVIDSGDALAYLANQGMVTPHVWLTRAEDPSHPDRLVFDLDPSTEDLGIVRDTALELRELLGAHGLVPYVKATGSRGLHVTVPLDRTAPIEAVRAFAEAVAADLADRHPDTLTTAFSKAERGTRLFLDVMRNGRSQTEVAAYGLRGLPGAPVAAPLEWSEVRTFQPRKWTVANIFRRLAAREDPWHDMDSNARPLPEGVAPSN